MNLKLSIITINLNNIDGLKKTVNSVTRQTFNEFEYIVIDGASTDGSLDFIKNNTSIFSLYISEPDTGVYQAMNKGIAKAKGNYLLFLNSGDYLTHNNALAEVFSHPTNADILCCGCNILKMDKVVASILPPSIISFGYLYLKGLNHQSTFIKKELFKKLGNYDESFRYNADIEFWCRSIIFNIASTQSIPVIITNYNLEGISSQQNDLPEFKAEIEKIFNNPLLQKFIPDYDKWKSESMENKILFWAKSKKIIYHPIRILFYISKALSTILKKIW